MLILRPVRHNNNKKQYISRTETIAANNGIMQFLCVCMTLLCLYVFWSGRHFVKFAEKWQKWWQEPDRSRWHRSHCLDNILCDSQWPMIWTFALHTSSVVYIYFHFRTCPCRQTYLLIHALERGFKSWTFSFFLSVYLFLPILKLPFGSWNDDGMNDSRNHSQSSVCRVMLTSLVQLTSNFFLTSSSSSSSFGLCSEPVRSYVALELEFNHWEAKKTRHTTRVVMIIWACHFKSSYIFCCCCIWWSRLIGECVRVWCR